MVSQLSAVCDLDFKRVGYAVLILPTTLRHSIMALSLYALTLLQQKVSGFLLLLWGTAGTRAVHSASAASHHQMEGKLDKDFN